MTSLIHILRENYKDWETGKNADVDSWPLMQSPGLIIGIVLAYLIFVLKIGPSIMKNRSPMELKYVLVIYNAVQVIFSAFLVQQALKVDIPLNTFYSSACSVKGASDYRITSASWWYFIAKVTEFLDTIFFVLRKRTRQVSFLHVYHHSITMFFSWCYLKYSPGHQGAVVGLVNSLVHVVMYFYYMVSALGPAFKKYLWWKKYMTAMQLVQFCILIAYMSLLALSNCGQKSLSYFFLVNALIFLYLFSGFYKSSYGKNKTESTKAIPSSNGKHSANGTTAKFLDDTEAYSQITKDVILLNQGQKLSKNE